jgi:hypothetical protein
MPMTVMYSLETDVQTSKYVLKVALHIKKDVFTIFYFTPFMFKVFTASSCYAFHFSIIRVDCYVYEVSN